MKNIINRIRKNKKGIIACILITIIAIVLCIIFFRKNTVNKIQLTKQAESESNLVDLKVEVKDQAEDEYKCLLTFTSNDTDNKIKAIEYPDNGQKIEIADVNGKENVAIDYEFKANDIDKIFNVILSDGTIEEEKSGYTITYKNYDGSEFNKETFLKNSISEVAVINTSPTQSQKTFIGWSNNSSATEPDYFENGLYKDLNRDTSLYAVYTDEKSGYTERIRNDSLIGTVSEINTSGVQNITVNQETYSANVIVQNSDLVLDGETAVEGATLTDKVYEFGDAIQDCGNETDYAKNMVILKVNGNLTINNNVTLTACKNADGYGGPKGMFIYCTGNIYNNGTIDMTARGAKAEGQNIYLWKNENESYEYVPAEGANGAKAVTTSSGWECHIANGKKGEDGFSRSTGGGGSGAGFSEGTIVHHGVRCTGGVGANGTSYSGGTRWSRSLY